jgi:glycosyltransferase involved in cell wall biosynthesis
MTGTRWFRAFAVRRRGEYDAVLVSRPHNFRAVRRLVRRYFADAPLIYDAEALFFLRDKMKAEAEGREWKGEGDERKELALLREADVVMMVSDHEKDIASALAPDLAGRIRVWGHPVAVLPTRTPFRDRKDLLFVGGFQVSPSPNEDAVLWFVREVLPRVRARLDCRLRVVGFRSKEALGARAADGVDVAGSVDDLTDSYERARVFVVPNQYAAGIPLKLCEAMARGLPAVVSELIARQLGAVDGREVLVARSPAEYAEKVIALYGDEATWTTIRNGALDFVRRRNDPRTLESELDAIIKGALSRAGVRGAGGNS